VGRVPGEVDGVELTSTAGFHPTNEAMLTEEAQAFFTTRTGGKGSGLGLSFVARVVEDCGGRLEIESEPEVGTMMSMVLPAASER
jgi:signal transduction histidine kinase